MSDDTTAAPETFGAVRGQVLMQQQVTPDGERVIQFEWMPPDAQFAVVSREVFTEVLRHMHVPGVRIVPPKV